MLSSEINRGKIGVERVTRSNGTNNASCIVAGGFSFMLTYVARPSAQRLVSKVKEKVNEAFPPGGGFAGVRPKVAGDLSAVGLYEAELVL